MLFGAAQGDLNGDGVLIRRPEQSRHRSMDAAQLVPLRRLHHHFDRPGVALIHFFHLCQHLNPAAQIVLLHGQLIGLMRRPVQLFLTPGQPQLIAGNGVLQRTALLPGLLQLAPPQGRFPFRLGQPVRRLL